MKLALGMLLLAALADAAGIDAKTIIARSVEANQRDWQAAPQYSYTERDQEYDGTKKYEVSMILGSPYRRLVAVDGKPISAAEEEKQGRLLKHAIARRRAESTEERAARTSRYNRERKRDKLLMDQLTIAFDFEISGEEKVGSFDTYVLRASPKRGYQPPNTQAEVLPGMQGKLWIDKASFQWVKIEAEVVHAVSIAGFLARVEKGTRFELEKTPVSDGIWLRSHFAMQARARILGVVDHREKEEQTFSDYHRSETAKNGDL